jgi:hypothetical protein
MARLEFNPRLSGQNSKGLEDERWKALTKETTVGLVRQIVEGSDRQALRVLLDTRRLFYLKHEPPLLLPEFLMKLRDRLAPPERFDIDKGKVADCTYDLTLAKYSNLPELPQENPDQDGCPPRAPGPDCRNYYRAFLRSMKYLRNQGDIGNQAQEESSAASLLQRLVYKNFLFSRLECERATPFSVRYTWNVAGVRLILWYPSYMSAREFREWLKENVRDLNLRAPNEQRRIQELVDSNLPRGYHVPLDECGLEEASVEEEGPFSLEFYEGFAFTGSLADTVAQEKARNIQNLRPAMRRMGRRNLERCVLQIFSALAAGDYNATRVAEQYGISKAALSRFAGTAWFEKTKERESVRIPDLWRNTAMVLAGNPVFMETVLTSGVAGTLEEVLGLIKSEEREGNDRS